MCPHLSASKLRETSHPRNPQCPNLQNHTLTHQKQPQAVPQTKLSLPFFFFKIVEMLRKKEFLRPNVAGFLLRNSLADPVNECKHDLSVNLNRTRLSVNTFLLNKTFKNNPFFPHLPYLPKLELQPTRAGGRGSKRQLQGPR